VPTGSFTRLLTGPSFYLSWGAEGDIVPPRRITDLSLGKPQIASLMPGPEKNSRTNNPNFSLRIKHEEYSLENHVFDN
jgi:hypothetical protein